MQGLAFVPEVFESERGVIASERRMAVENDNDSILGENVRATAIMAHPYHWDVIGWMSDILSWRRDEVVAYYRTFYAPNNAVLILVGDFESGKAVDLIEKAYCRDPFRAAAPRRPHGRASPNGQEAGPGPKGGPDALLPDGLSRSGLPGRRFLPSLRPGEASPPRREQPASTAAWSARNSSPSPCTGGSGRPSTPTCSRSMSSRAPGPTSTGSRR